MWPRLQSKVVRKFSEFHEMRCIRLSERETCFEVLFHVFLYVLCDSAINGLLVGNAISWDSLFGCLFSKEFSAALVSSTCLLAFESIIRDLGGIDSFKVNSCGCWKSIDLVNALKRNTINFMGSGNQEETWSELLKENNSLSSEAAWEEDKYLTGFDARSEFGSIALFSSGFSFDIFGRVPLKCFDHWIRV